MTIFIKNMVSHHCVKRVSVILTDMVISPFSARLGEVELAQKLNIIQELELKYKLKQEGYALLIDKKLQLCERIKAVIIQLIHYSDQHIKTNFSVYLSEKTGLNYTYMSNVFKAENDISIQQFIIIHKIEHIKELMLYGEMNLSEISYKMHYSSIGHMSNQFKKITGLSPSEYRNLNVSNRIPLEDLGKPNNQFT